VGRRIEIFTVFIAADTVIRVIQTQGLLSAIFLIKICKGKIGTANPPLSANAKTKKSYLFPVDISCCSKIITQ